LTQDVVFTAPEGRRPIMDIEFIVIK